MAEEEGKAFRYNRPRAEGGDESSSRINEPKRTFKLKSSNGGADKTSNNTVAYVQILGTGMDTHDTLPSILLFFDKQRFIFNAGEGLQRFCAEHKIKLSKLDHVCLTRVCSETSGGLPGLLLTLAGIGEGLSVNIWGPSNLELLVDAMKTFIPHGAMVHTHSISHAAEVQAKSSEVATRSGDVSLPATSNSVDPITLDIGSPLVKISAVLLQPRCLEGTCLRPSDISVIYICELHEIMGKFNVEKAEALGLKDNRKRRDLVKFGKSVKSDCLDIMVHPSDVMAPPIPGPIILIVDCPTDAHLQELLSIQSLNDYYADPPQSTKTVNCIIHLSPSSVADSPEYRKWMKKFSSAQHIMAGHAMNHVKAPILKSSAIISTRLNYLCPQFFPVNNPLSPQHHDVIATDSSVSSEDIASDFCKIVSAENLLKFTLRPPARLGSDKSSIPSLLVPSQVIDELLSEIPEITDAAQHISRFWLMHKERDEDTTAVGNCKTMTEEQSSTRECPPSCLENIRRDDLEIVLLGTGSSQPSKYRNVTSIYINLFSRGSLLIDCGEGTLAQLRRRYGMQHAENAVKNLRCIWISHIHADHHTGLARILALRRDLLRGVPHEPLLVIGPTQLERFLDAYKRLEDLDMNFLDCRKTTVASWDDFESDIQLDKNQFFPASPINDRNVMSKSVNSIELRSSTRETWLQSCPKRLKRTIEVKNGAAFPLLMSLKKVLSDLGLERLISFPVVHCPEAFGLVLKAAERINSVGKVIPGWKVAYSGDTRPCPELIEASRGATVLIHEATFEDGMVEEAIVKNHSTTKEAIEVGDSAAVYRIILTHFSQRYPRIPAFDEVSMQKTCIAFDLMSVNSADLPVLPNILPYLKLLFQNEMLLTYKPDNAMEAAS